MSCSLWPALPARTTCSWARKRPIRRARQRGSLFSGGPKVEIGIAYGTEKQRWLEWAVAEFAKTSEGKHINVNLIPMGSLEGAHAILGGDKRINVWSPGQCGVQRHLRAGMAGKVQRQSDPERGAAGADANGVRDVG